MHEYQVLFFSKSKHKVDNSPLEILRVSIRCGKIYSKIIPLYTEELFLIYFQSFK